MERVMHIIRPWALTTAEILYHLPDHPLILQGYIWQELDLPPDLPKLHEFLSFWQSKLDGKLHCVRYDWCPVAEARYRSTVCSMHLH
ncbi:hypothetical protein A2765_03450 [Candidatus Kaiserbacteria bacterium RIFCSPHIGHO2_01_FULL_56_24]|uniref:Usg family protein n=1 Tax=Candidatus Kaiserbacteria bacterium RIFCSPHIGHO2_01_FULL_56_24 TaxID=1798487 RepID=A0A1F6DH78_9BACT|nr:MAG: hypothetical protein A2765_03450 [Candidatus Kaiserbacteria bacterium RIFCSPHIGHO2_01_FULL_56_24]